jgi:hypothetical protein
MPANTSYEGAAGQGQLGKLQFVQASAPAGHGRLAQLLARPAADVVCDALRRPGRRAHRQTGRIRELLWLRFGSQELQKCYGSPFAVETAHIKFKDTDVNARIIRSLFDTARQYRESIDVYGDKVSIEWPLIEHEPLVMHRAKLPEPKIPKLVKGPDFAKRLPKSDPALHHAGRLRSRQEDAPQLHPGQPATAAATRTWRTNLPWPLSEERDPLPECQTVRQLDLCGPLRPRIRAGRRENRQAARLHAGVGRR